MKDNLFLNGDLNSEPLLKNFEFLSIRIVDYAPKYNDSISVLGLGPSSTFVRALAAQEKIKRNAFTLYNDSNPDHSRIWFGGYDTNFIRSIFPAYKEASDEVVDRSFAWLPVE